MVIQVQVTAEVEIHAVAQVFMQFCMCSNLMLQKDDRDRATNQN